MNLIAPRSYEEMRLLSMCIHTYDQPESPGKASVAEMIPEKLERLDVNDFQTAEWKVLLKALKQEGCHDEQKLMDAAGPHLKMAWNLVKTWAGADDANFEHFLMVVKRTKKRANLRRAVGGLKRREKNANYWLSRKLG